MRNPRKCLLRLTEPTWASWRGQTFRTKHWGQFSESLTRWLQKIRDSWSMIITKTRFSAHNWHRELRKLILLPFLYFVILDAAPPLRSLHPSCFLYHIWTIHCPLKSCLWMDTWFQVAARNNSYQIHWCIVNIWQPAHIQSVQCDKFWYMIETITTIQIMNISIIPKSFK